MSMRGMSTVVISAGCHWRGKVAVREEKEKGREGPWSDLWIQKLMKA